MVSRMRAANNQEGVAPIMQALPPADRDGFWVLDRVAQDRAPFDQDHNRGSMYGWES
jgi:hypothetical protein